MQIGDQYNPWKLFTGVFIPEAIVGLTTISAGAKLMFGRLCWHAGKDGLCYPNQARLAVEIGSSERSVRAYIAELKDGGFITRSRDGNYASGPYSYGFVWHECLEQCLRKKLDSAAVSESPEPANIATGTGKYCHRNRQILPPEPANIATALYEEETYLREEFKENIADSDSHATDTDPEPKDPEPEKIPEETELTADNICEWVLNRFRDRTTKQQFMPMGKTRKRIEAMFSDLGEFSFRKKLDEFLKGDSHLIEDFVSGRPVTSKNSLRRAPDSGRAVFDRRVATANTLFSRQGPPGASNAQKRPNRPHTVLTQQMVERWNELVPHRPATFEGERGYDIPMLEQMRMDTEFMNAFDGIAGKVEAIAANKGPEASWLTFSWILQLGKSGQNWGRVMRGEFDFMAAKPERRRKSQADDVTDDLIRRLESGEYKP